MGKEKCIFFFIKRKKGVISSYFFFELQDSQKDNAAPEWVLNSGFTGNTQNKFLSLVGLKKKDSQQHSYDPSDLDVTYFLYSNR